MTSPCLLCGNPAKPWVEPANLGGYNRESDHAGQLCPAHLSLWEGSPEAVRAAHYWRQAEAAGAQRRHQQHPARAAFQDFLTRVSWQEIHVKGGGMAEPNAHPAAPLPPHPLTTDDAWAYMRATPDHTCTYCLVLRACAGGNIP